ncbi:hypothetical protein JKF63_03910 [Porcisia hertigi]|uniref:Uncharacterized protein n=1 Tax=Porcisia hertigi TaxID=2761500 RepID=A0A836L7G3_9TRYP|nr:hypothetical protein JKF63_03910 [Porcisia hertigi]
MESFLSATLPATTRAPSGEGPREKALPSLNACEQSPPRTVKRATWRSFVCRVDVLWTVLFFTLLASVGVGIAVITKTLVSNAVLESWHTLHDLHAHVIGKWLNQRISVAYYMGANLASLSARSSLPMQSESTLATICSILTAYDKQMLISTLSIASLKHREVINCMHGFTDNASTDRFAGYVSYNHSVNATYFVDKDTFRFHRPLRVAKKWPDSVQNISHYIEENTKAVPILRIARKCDTGHISDIGRRHIWRVGTYLPHLLALNTPACIVDRSLPDRNHGIITDYVHLHINGSRLLQEMDGARLTGARIALFINHTLAHADPLIMSNNWGQPTTHNTVIYTPLLQSNTTYLKSSDIHDPLMRAALKRVNLAALQVEGYRYTVDFQYECAPATVTAWSYMTSKGLVLPLIYVSGQADITPPHTCIDIVSNCTVAAAVLVLTAVFWCLIHRTFSKPLSGLQASLLASVEHGERQLYRPGRGTRLVRFAEVEALIKAHNKTMQQLRDVDAFVPEGLRQRIMDGTTSHSEDAAKRGASTRLPRRRRRKPKATPLSLHLSTVVYVSIRANASITTALAPSPPPPPPPPRLDEEQDPHWLRGQQRLIAVAERTAQAANTANSGPFPTPAALTARSTASTAPPAASRRCRWRLVATCSARWITACGRSPWMCCAPAARGWTAL